MRCLDAGAARPVVFLHGRSLPNLTVLDVGPGLHFLPEDQPTEIGDTLSSWLRTRLDLHGGGGLHAAALTARR